MKPDTHLGDNRTRCQMTKQRRTFSPEFKREAADLVLK